MAGCMPCFIIPLLLFIFHKFIQPYLLKIWNPWGEKAVKNAEDCKFNCECSWKKTKKNDSDSVDQNTEEEALDVANGKVKVS